LGESTPDAEGASLVTPGSNPARTETAFDLLQSLLKIFHDYSGIELKIPQSQSIVLIVSNEFWSGAFEVPKTEE
jgi:hypothetical protein